MLSNVENDPDNGQRNDHTLSAFGTKRTSARACVMSANDP